TNSCGVLVHVQDCVIETASGFIYHDRIEDTGAGTYADEYTTSEMVGNAKGCADANLSTDSFSPSKPAQSKFTLTSVNNSVNVTKRSEEHTSELQSRGHLVCRLL